MSSSVSVANQAPPRKVSMTGGAGLDLAEPDIQVKPCYRTAKAPQRCTICGERETQMHMPIGHIGYFCKRCCPACTGVG